MTRARDTSQTQDNGGLAVAPYVAGKNALINGNMDFFQRSSFSGGANGYALDRWYMAAGGGTTAVTQQTTGAPLGSRYVMRLNATQASAYCYPNQIIETSNAANYWGKTVTLSVKVRRNSTYTNDVTLKLYKSATVDASYAATWTSITTATVTNANIPTGTTSADWYTLTLTAAVPNDGTANSLMFSLEDGSVALNGYKEYSQTQLEIGSVATPFSRAGGSIQGELAACDRCYERYSQTVNQQNLIGDGIAVGANAVDFSFPCRTAFRVFPTSLDSANIGLFLYRTSTQYSGGTWAIQGGSGSPIIRYTHGSNVFTIGDVVAFITTSASNVGYIGLSAEL